jgi:hypothetical protein
MLTARRCASQRRLKDSVRIKANARSLIGCVSRTYICPMAVGRRGHPPIGSAWPITVGELRESLGEGVFAQVSQVWHPSSADLISVRWSAEGFRRPESFAADAESVAIWIGVVGVDAAQSTSDLLCEDILPEIREWIRDAYAADDRWQGLDHSVSWTLVEGEITKRTHDESIRHRQRRRF